MIQIQPYSTRLRTVSFWANYWKDDAIEGEKCTLSLGVCSRRTSSELLGAMTASSTASIPWHWPVNGLYRPHRCQSCPTRREPQKNENIQCNLPDIAFHFSFADHSTGKLIPLGCNLHLEMRIRLESEWAVSLWSQHCSALAAVLWISTGKSVIQQFNFIWLSLRFSARVVLTVYAVHVKLLCKNTHGQAFWLYFSWNEHSRDSFDFPPVIAHKRTKSVLFITEYNNESCIHTRIIV